MSPVTLVTSYLSLVTSVYLFVNPMNIWTYSRQLKVNKYKSEYICHVSRDQIVSYLTIFTVNNSKNSIYLNIGYALSLSPKMTRADIFKHTCLQSSLKTSPRTHRRSHMQSFITSMQLLKILLPRFAQRHVVCGGPWIQFLVEILFFLHRATCKLLEPLDMHSVGYRGSACTSFSIPF